MAQILDVFLEKVTFFSLHLQAKAFQSGEDFFDVPQVFYFVVTKYDNVIQIAHSELATSHQYFVY